MNYTEKLAELLRNNTGKLLTEDSNSSEVFSSLLKKYKGGAKIHIKKKNRGKFTQYCGGTVTNACIKRAKASGNPTLVKRATFADNARHWKH